MVAQLVRKETYAQTSIILMPHYHTLCLHVNSYYLRLHIDV